MKQAKFREFDGIGGPQRQLLRRFNDRGWDISNSVANETVDLSLFQHGSMILRNGMRKISTSGESSTISEIFPVSVGNVLAYGVVVAGALTVITLPTDNVRLNPLELSPGNTPAAVATVYPATNPSISY